MRTAENLYKGRDALSPSVSVLSQGKPARKPGTQRHEATARETKLALCSSACQYWRGVLVPSPRCVDTPHRWMMGVTGWDPPPHASSPPVRRATCRANPQTVDWIRKALRTRWLLHARHADFRGVQ
jgi:hypothetical protein